MTEEGEDASLTPYEMEMVARMEEELDLREPGPPGGGPVIRQEVIAVAGFVVAAFGAVIAFAAETPLTLAGWILVLVGLVMIWERID
jgi:hypothetical protein